MEGGNGWVSFDLAEAVRRLATAPLNHQPGTTFHYTEAGTITFAILPSGELVPFSVMNNFTASFNGGADTFTGRDSVTFGATTFTNNWTILGGTGIFSGATGFATATGMGIASSGNPDPTYFGTVANSGSGQITAPGLNAVPEPATYGLFGIALGAVAVANRKRLLSCLVNIHDPLRHREGVLKVNG